MTTKEGDYTTTNGTLWILTDGGEILAEGDTGAMRRVSTRSAFAQLCARHCEVVAMRERCDRLTEKLRETLRELITEGVWDEESSLANSVRSAISASLRRAE